MPMIRFQSVLPLMIFMLLLTACSLSFTSPNTPPPVFPTATEPDGPGTGAFQTYTDRAGFKLDYPTGWTLLEPSPDGIAYAITLLSYDLPDPSKQNSEGEPIGTKIDIYVDPNMKSVDDLRAQLQQEVNDGVIEIQAETSCTRADGGAALCLDVVSRFGMPVSMWLTEISGQGVSIVCFGQKAECEPVALSVRLAA